MINPAGIAVDTLGFAWDRLGEELAIPAPAAAEVFGRCGGARLYRRALLGISAASTRAISRASRTSTWPGGAIPGRTRPLLAHLAKRRARRGLA